MLDRSVPQATFAAVTDGCSKWIALAHRCALSPPLPPTLPPPPATVRDNVHTPCAHVSSATYGKALCNFVEYLKVHTPRCLFARVCVT